MRKPLLAIGLTLIFSTGLSAHDGNKEGHVKEVIPFAQRLKYLSVECKDSTPSKVSLSIVDPKDGKLHQVELRDKKVLLDGESGIEFKDANGNNRVLIRYADEKCESYSASADLIIAGERISGKIDRKNNTTKGIYRGQVFGPNKTDDFSTDDFKEMDRKMFDNNYPSSTLSITRVDEIPKFFTFTQRSWEQGDSQPGDYTSGISGSFGKDQTVYLTDSQHGKGFGSAKAVPFRADVSLVNEALIMPKGKGTGIDVKFLDRQGKELMFSRFFGKPLE